MFNFLIMEPSRARTLEYLLADRHTHKHLVVSVYGVRSEQIDPD